jgi:hypothetical protein
MMFANATRSRAARDGHRRSRCARVDCLNRWSGACSIRARTAIAMRCPARRPRDRRTRDRTRRSPTRSPCVAATPSARTARPRRGREASRLGDSRPGAHTLMIAHMHRHLDAMHHAVTRRPSRGSPTAGTTLRGSTAHRGASRSRRAHPANGLPASTRVLRRVGGAAHTARRGRVSRTQPAAHARAMTRAPT